MRRQARADRGPELAVPRAAIAGVLLAIGLALSPAATGPVAAATGRLLVSADATYVVAPADRAVHVSVAIRVQNDKPSTAVYYYFWRNISWTVQREATRLRAHDGSGALRVSAVQKSTYQNLTITLRRDLLYKQASTITLDYDLPDGGARSGSNVHVGSAFVAFEAWTWGDKGKGSLLVRVPASFTVTTDGSAVRSSTASGVTVLTATAIADPFAFYVDVSGLDSSRLSSDPVSLPGGVDLVVRGWPEDTEWRSTVVDTLKSGLPKLIDLIGLPWRPTKPLEVSEAFGPSLEGYAGLYLERDSSIKISDRLDKVTILHEASHIWFNSDLFTDRWIDEGFAQEYSVEAAAEIGVPAKVPARPNLSDPGHVPLIAWQKPARITDETEDTETFGYNASWYVIHELVAEIGPTKMQAVVAAADADTISYLGAGPPEPSTSAGGWQRFLDLLENLGGSTEVDDLYWKYVADRGATELLELRNDTRKLYGTLVRDGRDWAPPLVVRQEMSNWQFPLASIAIKAAETSLHLRDKVTAAAAALDLSPGRALEAAYEGADGAMSEVDALASDELDALAALKTAHEAVSASPDFLTSIGLLGSSPGATYDAAGAAYEADDLEMATADANAVTEAVAGAPGVARQRLGLAGGGAILLLGGGLFIRRRRRSRAATAIATGPAHQEPYATLAADPHAGGDPQVDAPVDRDGGPPGSGGPTLEA